jgi:gluconate 2-dehydrogenase gamma chain
MGKRNLSRRQFLARAAAGAGAVAGAGLVGSNVAAASGSPPADAPMAQDHVHEAMASVGAQDWASNTNFVFFNTPQGRTVDAIASRLIPTDDLGPGAHEAGVVFYIDRALAGPYMALQETYRAGLAALDAYSQATFGGLFRNLEPDQQDAILREVEAGRATTFNAPTAQAFFNLVWFHTREGMFSDPSHGGNRDFIGWRLLQHPGVQWENAAEVQWNGPAPTTPMRALADWGWRL